MSLLTGDGSISLVLFWFMPGILGGEFGRMTLSGVGFGSFLLIVLAHPARSLLSLPERHKVLQLSPLIKLSGELNLTKGMPPLCDVIFVTIAIGSLLTLRRSCSSLTVAPRQHKQVSHIFSLFLWSLAVK